MKRVLVLLFIGCSFCGHTQEGRGADVVRQYCSEGLAQYHASSIDTAIHYFLEAEVLALQLPETAERGEVLDHLAASYQQVEFLHQALDVYESALTTWRALQDTAKVLEDLEKIGDIHLEFANYEQAISNWQSASALLKYRQDFDHLDALYKKIDAGLQNLQSTEVAKVIPIQRHQKLLQQQAIDHRFEKALLQLELEQEKTNLQFTHDLEQEKSLLRTTSLVLLLAALLLIVLYIFFQMKRKANHSLVRLNQEISGQKERLEEQKSKLEALDRMKSHFFTNISHEFRTPLTIIDSALQEIQEREPSPAKGLEVIDRNNKNLLLLVNQILDLRKLESDKMKLEPVQGDLILYLDYLLESFSTLADSQGKKLHFLKNEATLIMDYDPDKLLQVISNLLSNAIKYTPARKDIYLTVRRESQNGDHLILCVKDSGPGIPKDRLAFVFDRFYQLDDWIYRRQGSTGIGLALTQELIQLMGGSIEVNSVVGEGSSFYVRLPITRNARLRAHQHRKQVPAVHLPLEESNPEDLLITEETDHLPKVLLVEDNSDVVHYTISLLKDQYQIVVARDGQEGLEIALDTVPDLVVSDLKMPLKTGYELCQALKTDPRTSHIPIVLVSALADQEARNDGLRSGADAFLIKPFNREELFIRLEQLLTLRYRLQERYKNLGPISPSQDPIFHKEDVFMIQLQEEIEAHLDDENFGIMELCKSMGMSRSHLHLKIKALTNRSTSHYIRSFRLRHAREKFRTTEHNVTEVAFEVGFRDLTYFSRSFSAEFGLSPTDYLKSLR